MPAQLLPQHALYRYIFGELNATKCNYHGTLFSVHALDNLTLLEPDVQDLTAIAHEPSSSRICKSNCPVATHCGQLERSATLIRIQAAAPDSKFGSVSAVITTVRSYSWPSSN